ncbi:hypothetical protein [Streptomyces rubellomurinus]|uniref:hypothetical protein n=1 Tax=Streptomyces rubellomurinus (strain ATCC 31215) TaxID=359131 RepID=UPI0005F177E4|nr:hypothetical protein [Streptomyces rubellomurinus]
MQNPPTAPEAFAELVAAFPAHLAEDVRAVAARLPSPTYASMEPFSVEVCGERVAIPYRIHLPEPPGAPEQSLTGTQRAILHCLYTRNSDGRVRQRHLEQVLGSTEPWVVPFVLQLVGEYVLEILEAVRAGLPGLTDPASAHRRLYGDFIARNPRFFGRTERRVVSYWACYYRRRYPEFAAYPGSLLVKSLRRAAADQPH